MKMYRHLDNAPIVLCKTMFFFQRKGIFVFPKNFIGWLLTIFAVLLIWLCCFSLGKCIVNPWQLLKDQFFWTAIVTINWYVIAIILSPHPSSKKTKIYI